MMLNTVARRIPGLIRIALLICATWMILAIAPSSISISSSTYAAENQCAVPQSSCGCPTCGCGGGGYGQPSCPAGQVLYDDYCVPGCPSGYTRYPGLPGLCIPPCHHGCPDGYDQVPLPECPQGYHRDLRNPDNCEANQTGYGQCPDGMAYSFESGQCEFSCPRGFFLNENRVCESYYTRECPPNYSRNPETGKCQPPGVWPPNYAWVCLPHCPAGTYRDIREPTRCIPPPPTCAQGYDLFQGRCLPTCAKGVGRDDYGYCNPPPCPEGNYLTLRGLCIPVGCPQGSETFRGQCVPDCKIGLTRNNYGECVPPPQKQCPQGQRINVQTGDCERIPNNEPKCSNNTTYSSRSKRCEPNQPQIPPPPPPREPPACKPGWRLDGNGRCAPPKIYLPRGCPDGTALDRRTKRCRPINDGTDNGQNDPYVPPGQNDDVLLPKFNPDVLRQLIPRNNNNIQGGGRTYDQTTCPDGQYPDKNGRCVGQ